MVMIIVERTALIVYLLIGKGQNLFLQCWFFFFVMYFNRLAHIFEPCHIVNYKVEPLPWTARHGSRVIKSFCIFNCKIKPLPWTAWHGSNAFKPCHILNYKVEPLYVISNHVSNFFNWFLVKEKSKRVFFKNPPRPPEGPGIIWWIYCRRNQLQTQHYHISSSSMMTSNINIFSINNDKSISLSSFLSMTITIRSKVAITMNKNNNKIIHLQLSIWTNQTLRGII